MKFGDSQKESETATSAEIFAQLAVDRPSGSDAIFHRYIQRLSQLARAHLSPRLAQRVDPEDIVMSAYRSFFVAADAGRFSIDGPGQLWALLAQITMRKLYRSAAAHTAEKRDYRREAAAESLEEAWLARSNGNASEDAVALADEVESVLSELSPSHRRIVELRLQGCLIDEIAREVRVNEKTVRRVLRNMIEAQQQKYGIAFAPTVARPTKRQARQRIAEFEPSVSYRDIILKRLIGRGGMGKIYEAVDTRSDTFVAVKFLHRRFGEHPDRVEQFLREADILSRLSHSSIVPYRGVGRTDGGVCYLVMDLLRGETLTSAARNARFSDVIRWFVECGEAVAYAHEQGIIHCDLKPDNIVIREDQTAVVTDFGLAQTVRSSETDRAIAGSAPWMAPEQIEPSFGDIGPHTDVYGLGAALFTVLTGEPPYTGDRVADVLAKIVSATPPSFSDGRSDVPDRLRDLCLECLQKSPNDRPAAMSAILPKLREIEEEIR